MCIWPHNDEHHSLQVVLGTKPLFLVFLSEVIANVGAGPHDVWT